MTDPRAPAPSRGSGPKSSFDRVIAAASSRVDTRVRTTRDREAHVTCPVHPDRTPSMHVSWHPGQGGRGGYTMLYCFGCQARGEELAEALGLRLSDLFDEALPERERSWRRSGASPERRRAAKRRGHLGRLPRPLSSDGGEAAPEAKKHAWEVVARYPYVDRDGTVVQYAVRNGCADEGCTQKQFRQVFVDPRTGREVGRTPEGFVPVLYRLPEMVAAVGAGDPVWLMEGEKDADAAAADGLVATTNPGGAGNFRDELIPDLEGAHLRLVLDRDLAGMARGIDLHRRLAGVVASFAMFLPAPAAAKSDYSDHRDAGLGVDQLVAVTVTYAEVLHAQFSAQEHAARVQEAIEQADLHASLVGAVGDPRHTSAEEHRGYVRRWVLEGQIQFERLVEDFGHAELAALRDGSDTASTALTAVAKLMTAAQVTLKACHDRHAEPIPPILRSPEPGVSPREKPAPARAVTPARGEASQFRVWNEAIVQWKTGKPQPEDEDFDPLADNYKTILSLVVKITVREFEESAEDDAADEVPTMGRASTIRKRIKTVRALAAVRVRYTDPSSEEEMEVRVPVEMWRDHSWLEALPGAVDYDTRRAGKDVVQRAISAISAGEMVERTLHRSTGWFEQADGRWGFVHARGIITADGHRDEEVALDAGLERYDLPDPITDPARLREAFFEHSATMMGRLPDRVAAPALGHAYRSALGRHTSSVALVGQKATYKSSIAAKVMNHWGERWGRKRYGSSMSGKGDTDNVVRMKLHHARDTLYFLDDFAPTDGWAVAQHRLVTMARLVYNQEARGRLSRTGTSQNPGHAPRASALMTSEVMPPVGSGADRLLALPLAQNDVAREDLFPLDEPESRHGRALLTASFIAWLARDYLDRRGHYLKAGDEYAAELATSGRSTDREGDVLGDMWAGWLAMLDFLLEMKAIEAGERDEVLRRVNGALGEALAATVDPDQPRTAGGRVLELVRHAFAQGLAHVDDHITGDNPEWPIAARLGWRRTQTEPGSSTYSAKYRMDRMGIKAGYVCANPGYRDRGRVLMLELTALESILKLANASQTDQMQIDRATAQVALADMGVLIPENDKLGRPKRYTLPCRIPALETDRRFVVLWLDKVLGDDDQGDDDEDGVDGPDVGPEPNPADPTSRPSPSGQGGPAGEGPQGGGDAAATPVIEDVPGNPADAAVDGDVPAGVPAVEVAPSSEALDERAPSPGVDAAQQSGLASSDPPTDQPDKETAPVPQPYTFTPQAYRDRDGVTGWSEPTPGDAPSLPCAACGRPCVMTISGVRIHIPCWENSTATQRAATPPPDQRAAETPTTVAAGPAPAVEPAPGPQRRPRPVARVAAPGQVEPVRAAAVVDVDGVWASDGTSLPLPEGGITSVEDLLDLGRRLQLGTTVRPGYVADGQIWLGDALARELGIDVDAITAARVTQRDDAARDVTAAAAGVQAALEAGVHLGGRDSDGLGRWTRLWREGDRDGVRVALIAAMNPAQKEPRLLAGEPTNPQLARRIGLFTQALGFPFQHGAASTGLDLMVALRKSADRDRVFPIIEPVGPAMLIVEDDIDWCRPPTQEEAGHAFAHAYDRSGSYLGGIAGLNLGIGQATHHPQGTRFVKETPGYWRVAIPDKPSDWRHPALLDYTGKRHGHTRWVSTPTLQIALENDVQVEVLEAYTWPEKSRVLDGWYGRMRDARDQLDRPDDADALVARDQVKEIYTKAIGMLGSHQYQVGQRTYRPDWRHHIQGKSNANVLRRVIAIGKATGRWPVAIKKDTVVYTSDDPDPLAAWPGGPDTYGRSLGRYHHEGSSPLADQVQYLTGGAYTGRAALLAEADSGGE